MQMEILPADYSTSDFWLAGALLAAGMKMRRLDWAEHKAFFVFDSPSECSLLAEAYFRDDLNVRARRYSESLRFIKDCLFGRRGK